MNILIKNMKPFLFLLADRLVKRNYITSIRKGFTMLLPLIIIGSYSTLLCNIPFEPYRQFLYSLWDGHVASILFSIQSATTGFISPMLALTISYQYARTLRTQNHSAIYALPAVSVVSFLVFSGFGHKGFSLSGFSISSVAVSIAATFLCCKLYKLFMNLKTVSHNYTGIDTLLSCAFQTVLPAVIIISVMAVFQQLIASYTSFISLNSMIDALWHHLADMNVNHPAYALLYIVMIQLLCFFCIPYNNIFKSTMQTSTFLLITGSFYKQLSLFCISMTYISIGLSLLLFSKQKRVRKITACGFPAMLLNSNEIFFLGIPVAANPFYFIPFLLVPVVVFMIAGFFTVFLPQQLFHTAASMPVFINDYLLPVSIPGILLLLACITVGCLIFAPFVRLHDEIISRSFKRDTLLLTSKLEELEAQIHQPAFLSRTDNLGSVAQTLASDLKHAITKKEVFMVYQPQVNSKEEYIGAEALLRWNHPTAGYIYPPLIIELAKEAGLLFELEKIIFDETCTTISQLESEGIRDFKISVNITSSSILNDDFLPMVDSAIERYHIVRRNLSFEITEQEAFQSTAVVTGRLEYLKRNNHQLLIDDFGMGHTSLMYLETNLFDIVKLDGSLTRSVLDNPRIPTIINSITQLSQSLEFTIVSEYIESQLQKDYLAKLGSEFFQGYLYSKPLLKNEFVGLVKNIYAQRAVN